MSPGHNVPFGAGFTVMVVFSIVCVMAHSVIQCNCLCTHAHAHTQPQMCRLYDWEDPDKLMVGREIDLSKSRDSSFLKSLAEQLTIMEFAVFAAVQRW